MLTGDTNPVRRIQGIKHVDPYAAFEGDTPEFHAAVQSEGERWTNALKPDYDQWLDDYKAVLDQALPVEERYAHVLGSISIQYSYSHRKNVWINGILKFKDITEFLTTDDLYVVITDVGEGAELYELTVYNKELKKLWSRQPVGPTAALQGVAIYYQTPVQRLRYNKIKMANGQTGKQERTVYIETNPKFNTEILQPGYQDAVFIKSANALEQKLDIIVGKTVKRIKHDDCTLIPLSATHYLTNTRLEPITNLPPNQYAVSGIIHATIFYVITVSKGHHTLWRYSKKWEELKQAPIIRFLMEAHTPTVVCSYHYKSSVVYDILETKIVKKMPNLLDLSHMEGSAHNVPYTIVHTKDKKPTGLIVTAYGAYGIESQREYPVRWLPWLQRGYAFAVAMPRGGRDDGDAWYNGGRTAPRKHHTFEDTAAVIKAVQTRLGISPQRTLFYGRSAGGWVSAMMALQYSDRVAAVIAEVPYVDVLRTTSNPRLPLTTLEYDEFGDPLHKKSDYVALLKISPVDIAKTLPAQTTTVLLKTALHDSEVAAYESLKLAASMRKKGWNNVYVNIDGTGGHFVGRDKMASQYAEDAAFLQSSLLAFASASRRTRKFVSHVSKGTTRRAKSSSKQAIRTATSPEAV